MTVNQVPESWRSGVWADRPLFAADADVTVYWPDVRPCYEEQRIDVPAPDVHTPEEKP